MAIHSTNEDVILQFGLRKPAFRICVNTPTTHGSIGLTTGLDPAMTLGCGGWGGNITSDNISPKHLLNIKRLAYEVRPAIAASGQPAAAATVPTTAAPSDRTPLPKTQSAPAPSGISAQTLATKIDAFLSSRGYKPPQSSSPSADKSGEGRVSGAATSSTEAPAEFVCEDDVRNAMKSGRKLVIGERTIVTPSARDLGESNKVFVQAGWPR